MSDLLNIKDERFWDILFHEACVEGQQAERIEKELEKITIEPVRGECSDCSRRKFYQKGYQDGLNVNKWIPVSERLPGEEGEYLCCKEYINHQFYAVLNFSKNLHEVDKYDFPNEKCPGFYGFDSEYGYIAEEVIAWMPLPEPYSYTRI